MVLARNWWAFVLRGAAAILFGLLTFFMPGMALLTLVYMFGFYAIADGVFNLIAGFRHSGTQLPWWALLIEGLLGILAGIVALAWPGLTALVLLYVIAGWAVATGILEIVAAIRLRKLITGEWMLALMGVLSLAFGILIAIFPGAGALTVVLWIGAYAIIFGIMLIALGLRLHSWLRREEHGGHGYPTVAPG